MSLITQCPVCGTTFKVVRDQLKISEGWVRCGQCSEVFDSTPNLREIDSAAIRTGQSEEVVAPTAVSPVVDFDGAGSLTVEPELTTPDVVLEDEVSWPVAVADAPILVEPFAAAENPETHHTEPVEPVLQADPPDFSFNAVPVVRSGWHGAWARFGMVITSMALVLALIGQVIYRERDRLSAVDLRWRAALSAACDVLGCEIKPWRQIESIAVESSSFNKLRADTYRLNFVITNAADVQLAKPALELTLTDGQDVALMRRVLLPTELDAQVETISAHGEWAGSHLVSIAAPSSGLAKSVAGYRLLAFYP